MRVAERPATAERVLARGAPGYPPLLAAAPDPPVELYVRGHAALLGAMSVAVVGTRKATGLGREMAERISAELAREGVVVVSGCAVGIDAAAHRGALALRGPTVAVLAGGLDVAAPHANRALAERIARCGCLAGEHPPGTPVARWTFPRRNRIIAGLARIVVVVEAGKHSGALITARLALAAGREVMAVPGHPLLDVAAGVNGLLADGARPVTRARDVLDELGHLPPGPPAAARPGAEGLAGAVLSALGSLPRPAEELAARLRSPLGATLAALTELELLGLARADAGGRFSRAP